MNLFKRYVQEGGLNMKKVAFMILASLFLLFQAPAGAEEITIVGTGSGPAILKAVGQSFSRKYPGITINVPRSIGSGGGIKAVGDDTFLLARVSRKITPDEEHHGLTFTPIARLPIVFYVNPSVEVKSLSGEQVCGIYSGRIFNWRDVGGHNARIKVIKRQDGDSSIKILRESLSCFHDIVMTEFAKTTFSDPDTIAQAEKAADAIAFGAFPDVKDRDVVVLALDNVPPTDSAYPLYGLFGLVFKEKNRTGGIGEFIEFATAPAAHGAIKNAGGLPLPEALPW